MRHSSLRLLLAAALHAVTTSREAPLDNCQEPPDADLHAAIDWLQDSDEEAEAQNVQLLQLDHELQRQRPVLRSGGNATAALVTSAVNESVLANTSVQAPASRVSREEQLPDRVLKDAMLLKYTGIVRAPDAYWALASLVFLLLCALGFGALLLVYFRRVRRKDVENCSLPLELSAVAFGVVVLLGIAWLAIWYSAGAWLHQQIRNIDTSVLGLGAEVTVQDVNFNPWFGRLYFNKVYIGNPQGYHADHMITIGDMLIDISMGHLVTSFLHTVDVDEIRVRNIDIVYEQALTTSNVQDFLSRLSAPGKKSKEHEDRKMDIHLHKVNITGIWTKGTLYFAGNNGISLSVPDLTFKDFDKEFEAHKLDDILGIIFGTMLKSVGHAVTSVGDFLTR